MNRNYIFIIGLLLVMISLWGFYPSLWLPIVVCIVPMFVLVFIHGERIDIYSGRRLGVFVSVKGNALSLVGAFFVPGRITEILKPLYFLKKKSLPFTEGVSVLVVERTYDLLAVLCMGLIGLLSFSISDGGYLSLSRNIAIFTILTIVVVLAVSLIYPHICERIIRLLPFYKIRDQLQSLFIAFKEGVGYGIRLWPVFLTVSVWVGSWLIYWLFLQFDMGPKLELNQALYVFLIGTLGVTITITPGGLGTFEAAIVLILQRYGYDFDSALASAVGLRIIAMLPNVLIVSYVVFFEGYDFIRSRNEIKELKVED